MKRVIFLCNSYYPNVGGEKYYQRVAEGLAAAGLSIEVWTPRRPHHLPARELLNGVVISRYSPREATSTWLHIARNVLRLARVSALWGFDYGTLFPALLPLRFLFPTMPIFVTFLGHEGLYPIPARIISARKIAELMAQGCIAGGHYIEKWYGTVPDEVAYGGFDQIHPRSGEIPAPSAVFIGRLDADTGVLDYARAICLLRSRFGKSLRLDIYGRIVDEPTMRDLQSLISQSEGLVRYCGVAPSVEETLVQYRYAFVSSCLANLEAWVNRRIVFSVYSTPLKKDYLEMVPGARTFSEICGSAGALAERLASHLVSPDADFRMSEAGFAYASTQSWQNVVDVHLRLLTKRPRRWRYLALAAAVFRHIRMIAQT
jgi:glycosyltransferase involved in cell wall biosynthesis